MPLPRPAELASEGLIVGYVAVTHLFWSVALIFSDRALLATPVSGLSVLGPRPVIVALLGLSAMGSAFALLVRAWWVMWFLIPQQVLLGLSVGTAMQAVAHQQYADGVLRPWAFIASDQAPTIILGFVHLVAIVLFAEQVRRQPARETRSRNDPTAAS